MREPYGMASNGCDIGSDVRPDVLDRQGFRVQFLSRPPGTFSFFFGCTITRANHHRSRSCGLLRTKVVPRLKRNGCGQRKLEQP